MSSKQDKNGVRTLDNLEYKYGKTFAETMGIANDARTKAEEVEKKLNGDMTNKEIFNMLTNGGANQGLFRYENEQLYINAEYIQVVDALFANNINMSGKFTYTTQAFLEPDQAVSDTIENHIVGNAPIPTSKIPLYDFNNDGAVDIFDNSIARMCMFGMDSLADWSGAKKTDVTITIDLTNPKKAIRMTGTNMWGGTVERYIGMGTSSIQLPAEAQPRIVTGTVVKTFDGRTVDLFTIYEIADMFQSKYGIGYKDIDLYNLGVSLINGDANAADGYLVAGQWKGDTLEALLSTGLTGSYRINYAFTAYF